MTSTQDWINWAWNYARPYDSRSRQLSLAMAHGAGRSLRDLKGSGWSGNQELADADHYWFTRHTIFRARRLPGWIVGGVIELVSQSPMLGQVAGVSTSVVATPIPALSFAIATPLWTAVKFVAFAIGHPEWIPGGDEPSSEPTMQQMAWTVVGGQHAITLDLPRSGDVFVDLEAVQHVPWPPPPPGSRPWPERASAVPERW